MVSEAGLRLTYAFMSTNCRLVRGRRGNAVEHLQILCSVCNRERSDSL